MNYDNTNIWQDGQLGGLLDRISSGGASSATIVLNIENQSLTSNMPEPYNTCMPIRGFTYGVSRPSLRRGSSGEYETGADIFVRPLIIVADFAADLCEMVTRIAEMKNLGKLSIMELTHTESDKQDIKVEHVFSSSRVVDSTFEPGVAIMAFRYNTVNVSSMKLDDKSASTGNVSGGLDVVQGISSAGGGE